MLIRPATSLDAQSVGEIRVAAWKHAYQDFMPAEFLESLNPAANLDAMKLSLDSKPQPFLMTVAEVNGTCVGFSILGRPRYQAPESVVELWAMNVHPTHWRKGIGRRLVSVAISDARRQGYATVALWCISGNNAASRLYEESGFTLTGERRTTTNLTGNPLDELAYQKAL
jgi:GNAT superfamily N-acetyltransferase